MIKTIFASIAGLVALTGVIMAQSNCFLLDVGGVRYSMCGDATTPPSGDGVLLSEIDLSGVDWHTGSGSWGAQVVHELPTEPTTTRSVSVDNTTDFNTEAAVNGTEITITSGWATNTMVFITANDIDVIIPDGVAVGGIQIANFPYDTNYSRIRIRGSTLGEHDGGRMGQFRAGADPTDVIIDGIDINGDSSFSSTEAIHSMRPGTINRFAILNTRVISAAYNWLGDATNVTISHSNFYSGADDRTAVGYPEGWSLRNIGGPMVIFNSRFDSTRYATIRNQASGNAEDLVFADGLTVVSAHEARNMWVWYDTTLSGYNGDGAIFENSNFYSNSSGSCAYGVQLDTTDSDYTEIRDSNFYHAGNATWSQSYLNSVLDTNTNNSISSFSSLPAWNFPGDPTEIPLPSGLTLDTAGQSPCQYP